MTATRSSLLSLRAHFGGLPDRARKRIALRAIRNALRTLDSDPAYAAEQAALAEFHLPYAAEQAALAEFHLPYAEADAARSRRAA
jgi:hypothetical protein